MFKYKTRLGYNKLRIKLGLKGCAEMVQMVPRLHLETKYLPGIYPGV